MTGTQYLASADSALIRKVLGDCSGGSALEIGAGNGGSLVDLAGRFALAVGTDVVRPGMSDWSTEGANFVLADAASCLRDSTFDLVAFNPPYLRERVRDRATDGGLDLGVAKRFLNEALRAVKSSGKIVFLLNQEADIHSFEGMCEERGFRVRKLQSERVFFEELSVYCAERDWPAGGRSLDVAP